MSWALLFVHSSLDDAGLDLPSFRILAHLARRADGNGIAFPSMKSVAKICRINKDTVAKKLRELVKAGWLRRVKRPGLSTGFVLQEPIRNEGISDKEGYPSKQDPPIRNEGSRVIRREGSEGNPIKVIHEGQESEQAQPTVADSGDSPISAARIAGRARKRAGRTIGAVAAAWGAEARLPQISNLSAKRAKAVATRLKDDFFAEHYQQAIAKIAKSTFCLGENEKHWRANFDWFLKPGSIEKVLEGNYDGDRAPLANCAPSGTANLERLDRGKIDPAAFAAFLAKEYPWPHAAAWTPQNAETHVIQGFLKTNQQQQKP